MQILFVEDGTVDTTKLDILGVKYVICQQGSNSPKIIEVDDRDLTSRYIKDINEMSIEISIYKRALELACEGIRDKLNYKDIGTNKELNAEELEQMFIYQAKKELEIQDVKD